MRRCRPGTRRRLLARRAASTRTAATLRPFPGSPLSMSPVPRSSHAPSSFELRNASLALVALVLRTTDLERLSHALEARFGQTPLFEHDPVTIDLAAVADDPEPIDFEALAALLRRHRMLPVGVEAGNA